MANQIRNIAQTVQEREIVKTAPDVVIYIEGRPYIINPYLNTQDAKHQSDGLYTIVNFNDYVDSFSVSYRTDDLTPSGSFSLSVPSSQKYLFQAPGGNNIIETMMQVQVFAKGYYPSPNGNTLYYRVFKGLVTNVTYTDTGTSLQISVNLAGMLQFLAKMYIDLQPAVLTSSPTGAKPYESIQYKMNPYQALADTFLRAITPEGYEIVSIMQANDLANSNGATASSNVADWSGAIKAGYIGRWQTILTNIMRDVRILGYGVKDALGLEEGEEGVKDPQIYHDKFSKVPDDAISSKTPEMAGALGQRVPVKSQAQQVTDPDYYVDIMRKYLPDFSVKSLGLLEATRSRAWNASAPSPTS